MAKDSKLIRSESDKRQTAARAANRTHAVNRARRLAAEALRGNYVAERQLNAVPSDIRRAAARQCSPGAKRTLLLG